MLTEDYNAHSAEERSNFNYVEEVKKIQSDTKYNCIYLPKSVYLGQGTLDEYIFYYIEALKMKHGKNVKQGLGKL